MRACGIISRPGWPMAGQIPRSNSWTSSQRKSVAWPRRKPSSAGAPSTPTFPLRCPDCCIIYASLNNAQCEPQGIRVRMVFSQHDQFSSMARRLWDVMAETIDVKDRMGSLVFEDMRRVPALQAADLLAYELRHYHHLRKTRPASPPRWAFAEIVRHQQTVCNARMLKYLPGWYLKDQAEGVFEERMDAFRKNPERFQSQLNELFPEVI